MASRRVSPIAQPAPHLAGHDHAVEHRDARDGDEADRRRDRERQPAQRQRQRRRRSAPAARRRTPPSRSAASPNIRNSIPKMIASAIGTTSPQALAGAREVLELPAPLEVHALRAAAPSRSTRARASLTKLTRSRPRTLASTSTRRSQRLAVDHRRPLGLADRRRPEASGTSCPARRADQQLAERLGRRASAAAAAASGRSGARPRRSCPRSGRRARPRRPASTSSAVMP